MATIALGFSANKDGGRQGLIEHCLWLRGDDSRLVHAFLVVDNYVIDRTFSGVSVLPVSQCWDLIGAANDNFLVAQVDSVSVHDCLKAALPDTQIVGPMSVLDAFRWWHRLPIDGLTCFSYLYQLLGGAETDHVEPADLIGKFLDFVIEAGGQLVDAHTTLSYEVLRESRINPLTAFLLSERFHVKEN
jgi:hypothetical protein